MRAAGRCTGGASRREAAETMSDSVYGCRAQPANHCAKAKSRPCSTVEHGQRLAQAEPAIGELFEESLSEDMMDERLYGHLHLDRAEEVFSFDPSVWGYEPKDAVECS
jgi:hypothetical protein